MSTEKKQDEQAEVKQEEKVQPLDEQELDQVSGGAAYYRVCDVSRG